MPTEAKNFLQSVGLAAASFFVSAAGAFSASAASTEATEMDELSVSTDLDSVGSALATFAVSAFVALTLWLGNWQVGRAEEKRQRQALFESRMNDTPVRLTGVVPAEGLLYRHVRLSGRWMPERQFFVDNRIREGRAGFEVITPLALEGGAAVLVNRGWVARGPEYPRAPAVPAVQGRAEVAGRTEHRRRCRS